MKKVKIHITLILIFISLKNYGQGISDLNLEYSITPLNYLALKSRASDYDSLVSARNTLENKSYAITSFLKAGYEINPQLFLETGIGMSIMTSHSNVINSSSKYFIHGNNVVVSEYSFRYILLDFPIMTRYEILKRNFSILLVSGLTISKMIERDFISDITTTSGEQFSTIERIPFNASENNLLLSGKLGFQIEFDLKKIIFRRNSNLVTYYQIIYRNLFSSFWKDSIVERYHGIDFGCGIRYRLSKNAHNKQ